MTRTSFARGLKRTLMAVLALAVLSMLLCVALAAFALHTLAPKPGTWSHTLRIGSANHAIERQVSVPALLRLATHPAFPAGTNVEFARVKDGGIDLIVWERGVGRTLACGTGACATAVVALAKGLVRGPRVRVTLPGGDLEIEPGEPTFMTGPARLVFHGEVDTP